MPRIHLSWRFAIIFFLVLSVGSATFFLVQRKSFSSQDVHVVLENADNIASGSHATFRAGIQNDTNVALNGVSLAITLPDSMTIEGGNTHFAMLHWNSIGPNTKVLQDVSVAVSPGAGEGSISGQVDYSPKGFVGRFVASQNFPVTPSPLGITSLFDLPSSAVSGQEIDGSLHIIPGDNLATNDLWIEFVAPSNFEMEEASPQFDPSAGSLQLGSGQAGQAPFRWHVEGIQKGMEYVFRFRGIVHGSSGDEQNFQALFEEQKDGNFVTLAQNTSGVHISQTVLSISQTIDGAQNNTVQPGTSLTIHLAYRNKSDVALEDVVVSDALKGSSWNTAALTSDDGSWSFSTNTITWDKNKIPALSLLQPGDSGEVAFQVSVANNVLPSEADATLASDAKISSPHQSLTLGGAAFQGEDLQTLKIQGSVSLSASARLASSSPRGNVYAVTWEARANINNISSARVHASLASGVVWQNAFSPSDALLSYADSDRTLVWNVGDLTTGTPTQRVTFQVLIPASSLASGQKIFTDQFVEGRNDFIGVHAQSDAGALAVPGY